MATFTVTISAPYGDTDEATALRLIGQWNLRKPAELPFGNPTEIKASMEAIVGAQQSIRWDREVAITIDQQLNASNLEVLWKDASPEQRLAAIAALEPVEAP